MRTLLLPLLLVMESLRRGTGTTVNRGSDSSRLRLYDVFLGFLSLLPIYDFTTLSKRSDDAQEEAVSVGMDTPEDVAAKAIADSLVTQTLPTANTQVYRRRSVRILQSQAGDDFQASSLKSPTSAAPSVDILKKARHRASPTAKPLIPARPTRKTLILDLDETLIHSLSKGGKLSNGHMVEVKLGTHAILYYVYKRPHCDLFLERVSQWYDVVIFTASVQEYADPVIDWLEQDRKFFKARYYRQHCTYRYGAYMKDLSIAEPDLSRAIIIDNSPLSYRMNEENAIPIEGWISDPSDRDLLYLIPVLQNLHYLGDVRSLLSLRQPD